MISHHNTDSWTRWPNLFKILMLILGTKLKWEALSLSHDIYLGCLNIKTPFTIYLRESSYNDGLIRQIGIRPRMLSSVDLNFLIYLDTLECVYYCQVSTPLHLKIWEHMSSVVATNRFPLLGNYCRLTKIKAVANKISSRISVVFSWENCIFNNRSVIAEIKLSHMSNSMPQWEARGGYNNSNRHYS